MSKGQTIEDIHRRHGDELLGRAYAMLGQVSQAEDAVQEAFVRIHQRGLADLENPAAWLNTVVTRICIDHLRSSAHRRETYIGPWLPEPVVTAPDASTTLETGEALSMALMVVLESLSPAERVAFVMHDVFDFSYAEIGLTLDRSEAACRQLVSRSRAAIRAGRPRYDPNRERHDAVTAAFVAACLGGEIQSVMQLLAPDVVLTTDGGGLVSAALRPIIGAERVARFLLGLLAHAPEDPLFETAVVNGTLGIVLRDQTGNVDAVGTWDVAEGVITVINVVRNPEKLRHLT